MENEANKETYTWTFKVFGLLGILLLLITTLLYFSPDPNHVMAFRFASSTMFVLFAVGVWLYLEYLKDFKVATYKARRVPMWASIMVLMVVAFSRFM